MYMSFPPLVYHTKRYLPIPSHLRQKPCLPSLRTLLIPLDCFPGNDPVRRCGLDRIQDLEVFNAVTAIVRVGYQLVLLLGRGLFVGGRFGFVQEPACGEVVGPYWGSVEGGVF